MDESFYIFYHAAMILSLLVTAFLSVLTWQRRRVPGARAMIALAISTFVWALGYYCEANSGTLERQLFFTGIAYIGSMGAPLAWFLFALNYTADNIKMTGRKIAPLCIIPLFALIMVWTNNWHHLMWSGEHLVQSGYFMITVKAYGPLFWIMLAYNYLLMITGAIILIRRLFIGTCLYAGQAISLVIAVALPLLWNAVYVFDLFSLPRKDLTPVMFAISGLLIIMGLMRFQLLAAVPFARKFLIQHLHDGILAFDLHNRLLEANPAALSILALDKNIIGQKIDNSSPLSPVIKQISSSKPDSAELTLEVSKEERYYELETVPMHDNIDRHVGWLAILRDITERKRRELEYKTIIKTAVDGFWLTDTQGRFLEVNNAYCQMIGYSHDELLKMSISDIEAIETRQQILTHIARIMGEGKDRFETRHRHKDGSIIDVEVSANYLEGGGGRMMLFIRDITERKKLHEQLIAQDRLVSIGELTAGVAHELNNPLTSLIGYSGLLRERDLPADIKEDIIIINNEAKRAARIINNLLTFARKHREGKSPADINEVIRKTLALRTGEQKLNNIRTITHLAADLPELMVNGFQLQQVFLNIIINAEFFMLKAHKKGMLTIVTEQAGNFIRIKIMDDGPGITKKNLNYIFNPFFTTKDVGEGTGLGLSICHGIITEHGGSIRAESKHGEGAAFIIELPVNKVPDRE
ncbi:MAG: histidine kinase N-terminal 7TM domain-containing protein [Dehalococcoidales bacterium]|nr:histidine kinase N-terminal 7TM domain-containing protein [Dehalococcoidales bacterium]